MVMMMTLTMADVWCGVLIDGWIGWLGDSSCVSGEAKGRESADSGLSQLIQA
jgi:hypothetical protein